MKEREKYMEYTLKLTEALGEVFNEESDNFIGVDELKEGDNATHFMHALMNLVPAFYYSELINETKDLLEVNHVSNRLIMQFADKTKEKINN